MDFATEALNQHEAMLRGDEFRCPAVKEREPVCVDGHDLDVTKVVMFRTVSNDFQPGEELDYDMPPFSSVRRESLRSRKISLSSIRTRDHIFTSERSHATTVKAIEDMGYRVDLQAPECGAQVDARRPWEDFYREALKE